MLRAGLVATVAAALVMFGAPGARASASARADVAATSRYVTAASNLFRALIAQRRQEIELVNAIPQQVSLHCRAAVPAYLRTGSPAQQRVWTALVNDLPLIDIGVAVIRAARHTYVIAAHDLERLRWSEPGITGAVSAQAHRAIAALTLRPADPCAEVWATAASGFTTVPTDLTRFFARVTRVIRGSDVAPGFGISVAPLALSLSTAQRPRVRALHALEARFTGVFFRMLLAAYAHTIEALRGPEHRRVGPMSRVLRSITSGSRSQGRP